MAEKCTKLIFSLSKRAKLNWGLQHAALKTIYTGGIQPLLLYGAPVWNKAIDMGRNKHRHARVQRLINIKIAKAYRTVSTEALSVLTGLTPITIKIEEASKYYHIIRSCEKDIKVETRIGTQYWQHPAETITLLPEINKNTSTIQIYTDGSNSENGVGAGITIYKFGDVFKRLKYKLNNRCTNSQAEQLVILKAVQYKVIIHAEVKTATVYTDSRITLDSIKNSGIHGALVEKIRQKMAELKKCNGTSNFAGLKLTSAY
jgi:hypothetical protein